MMIQLLSLQPYYFFTSKNSKSLAGVGAHSAKEPSGGDPSHQQPGSNKTAVLVGSGVAVIVVVIALVAMTVLVGLVVRRRSRSSRRRRGTERMPLIDQ